MHSDLEKQILDLRDGDHLCLFYEGSPAEQMPALIPFIREGLARNEQFIYIADDQTVSELADCLAKNQISVTEEAECGRLKLWTRKEWRQAGKLCSSRKAEQVRRFIDEASKAGFKGIRFAVEMTWTLGPDISAGQLEHWEATINTLFTPDFPGRIICQYNCTRLSPEVLLAALHSHPLAILGDEICPNLFYEAPLILSGEGNGHSCKNGHIGPGMMKSRVDWMVSQLKRARRAELDREELAVQAAAAAEAERHRKRLEDTEAELRRRTEELVSFVETATVGLHWVGEDGTILWANRADFEPLGYTKDEYIGHNIAEFHVDQEALAEIFDKLKQGERLQDYPARLKCKDNSVKEVLIHSSVHREGGRFLHTQCITRDVTAQRAAERRLSIQYRISSIFAEPLPVEDALCKMVEIVATECGWHVGAVWSEDKQAGRLRCAAFWHDPRFLFPEFSSLTRQKSFQPGEGLPGQVWLSEQSSWINDLTVDANFPRALPATREGLRTAFSFPVRIDEKVMGVIEFFSREERRPDNHLLEMTAAIGNQVGQFLQRKQNEDALRASEAKISQLICLMPAAVYTCDEQGRLTFFNKRAAEFWGRIPQLGTDDQKFCGAFRLRLPNGTILPHEKTPMALAVTEGVSTKNREVVIERTDGTTVTVVVNIEPLHDEAGQRRGAINVFQDISDYKAAQEALEESRQRLVATFNQAAVGIAVADPEGNFIEVNERLSLILGYSLDELMRLKVTDVTHAEDLDRTRDQMGQLLAGKVNDYSYEKRFIRKDGAVIWCSTTVTLIKDSAGKPRHFIGVVEDISFRKRAEEAAARLAAIVESSDDAIVGKDLDGTITTWNGGAQRMFGYSAEEMIGKSIRLLIPEDRQTEEGDILSRVRGSEAVEHYETVRRHKDGRLVDVSLTVSPIKNSEGKIIGASKIARDITDRKRAEAQQRLLYELVASVNRARNIGEIFEEALDCICECQKTNRASILLRDADGVMRFRAWRGLSGAYRAAVEGHSPWKPDEKDPQPVLIQDVNSVMLEEHLRTVIAREGIRALAFVPLKYEKRLLGKFMIYHSESHNFSEGEIRSVEAIASQVAFAIERRKISDSLERQVNERTASLREAVAQMEEFSYTVSHDLRAPLRGMQIYTNALLEDFSDSLPSEARHYLKRVEENANRLDKMIIDVLTFSRVARTEVRLERVRLDRLVRQIVEQYPGMQSPKAEVTIEPLPDVVGHEPSLTQAISNLLNNAVKFVAPGVVPRVKVWSESCGRLTRIWFGDNGIGIDPKYHHRLFNMFERIHPDLAYEGTGVGLAIVRKAVERMGGRTGVESLGEGGSRFWIEISGVEADNESGR